MTRHNYTRPFQLQTDWSQDGVGAVLIHYDEAGQEFVVAFASRSCNDAERNYSAYDGESLAAVWAVQHFRHYLIGSPFLLLTDHKALEWTMTTSRLTGRLARWSLILQEYDFKIKHTPGVANAVANCCSKFPLPSSHDEFREKREELGTIFYADV